MTPKEQEELLRVMGKNMVTQQMKLNELAQRVEHLETQMLHAKREI